MAAQSSNGIRPRVGSRYWSRLCASACAVSHAFASLLRLNVLLLVSGRFVPLAVFLNLPVRYSARKRPVGGFWGSRRHPSVLVGVSAE